MSNPLVSALENLFEQDGAGLDQRPLTVRTAIKQLASWTPGAPGDLAARLHQLVERVQDAHNHTHADLQVDRDEELAGYLRELHVVYAELSLSLQSVRRAVQVEDTEAVQAEVVELRSLLARLSHWDGAVKEWNERVVLRCPRCGRTGGDVCTNCRLELLYSDTDALARPGVQARLGPEHTAVFKTWNAVASGEASLSSLWAPLEALEIQLRRYAAMTRSELAVGMAGDKVTRILKRIALASQESLSGAAQMRQAASTRRARDLNEGWDCVFDFAVEIQECVPELARALGRPGSSAAPVSVQVQDTLLIDFD